MNIPESTPQSDEPEAEEFFAGQVEAEPGVYRLKLVEILTKHGFQDLIGISRIGKFSPNCRFYKGKVGTESFQFIEIHKFRFEMGPSPAVPQSQDPEWRKAELRKAWEDQKKTFYVTAKNMSSEEIHRILESTGEFRVEDQPRHEGYFVYPILVH